MRATIRHPAFLAAISFLTATTFAHAVDGELTVANDTYYLSTAYDSSGSCNTLIELDGSVTVVCSDTNGNSARANSVGGCLDSSGWGSLLA